MSVKKDSLGGRVRARREAMNLSQEDLARRVGCTVGHIGKIECGDTNGSVAMLARLAMELSVSTDWLIRGTKPATK